MQIKRQAGWWPHVRAWWDACAIRWGFPSPGQGPAHLHTGLWGEEKAAAYLRRKGMKVLAKRVRLDRRKEELDLVVRDGQVLVFVEVKTRSNERFGRPFAAITAAKRRHVTRAGLAYLRQLREPPRHYRFDVVEVIGQPATNAAPEIRHIRNAFSLPRNCRYAP